MENDVLFKNAGFAKIRQYCIESRRVRVKGDALSDVHEFVIPSDFTTAYLKKMR